MFKDRKDAGGKLADKLERFRSSKPLILAIPKGGAEAGYYIAAKISAEFSIIIVRKLPFPDNPEAGFGAVAEDGSLYLAPFAENLLPQSSISLIIEQQKKEITRRQKTLRGGRPLPGIEGRTVILVDDGIAMGSTMRAAIKMCRSKGAEKIIAAAPVAGEQTARQIAREADEAVILHTPSSFRAVADYYENWYDVPDSEVIDIMSRMEEGEKTAWT